MFYVYIIWSSRLNRFYIGTTDNVEKRIIEHNEIKYPNAFTSKGIPWTLFLLIECKNSMQAFAIEKHLKKMKSKKYIQNLAANPQIIQKIKNNLS